MVKTAYIRAVSRGYMESSLKGYQAVLTMAHIKGLRWDYPGVLSLSCRSIWSLTFARHALRREELKQKPETAPEFQKELPPLMVRDLAVPWSGPWWGGGGARRALRKNVVIANHMHPIYLSVYLSTHLSIELSLCIFLSIYLSFLRGCGFQESMWSCEYLG